MSFSDFVPQQTRLNEVDFSGFNGVWPVTDVSTHGVIGPKLNATPVELSRYVNYIQGTSYNDEASKCRSGGRREPENRFQKSTASTPSFYPDQETYRHKR